MTHADISPRTYDFFRGSLHTVTPEVAEIRIRNAIVYGYWKATQGRRTSREDFFRYRANYYDEANPYAFTRDLIQHALPHASFGRIEAYAGVSLTEEELAPVRNAFLVEISNSRKGRERPAEENRQLSDRDARLMMSLLKMGGHGNERTAILGRRAYLLSASARYIQVDRRLGLNAKLNARPQIVAALIDLISDQQLDDAQFVKLFENSILADAVDAIWADVKGLLDAGVALSGANVVRLRYDLSGSLHNRISALHAAEDQANEAAIDEEYLALLKEVEELGYFTVEELQRAKREGKLMAEKIEELARENEVLQEAVKHFGQKRQRWIERQKAKK